MKYLFTILLVLVLGLSLFLLIIFNKCEEEWCFIFEFQKERAADSFERCAALGFPVMESYPRQCRAGAKSFVEDVTPAAYKDLIRVTFPLPNALVTSPLTVQGEARGMWYFEASFPARLIDGNGREIAIVPATALGEWMTADYVPFSGTLTFAAPTTSTGTLIFQKDNASGLPEHDDSFSIPVRFR